MKNDIFDEIKKDYKEWKEENQHLLIEAEKAIARLKERENETVEEWIARLMPELSD